MGNDIHEKINFDFNKYHTMGDALNNNDNIDENMNYKYSRNFNKVNKYETSLGNNIKDQMNVSNRLFLRTSPRRKYNPIEIYLNQDEN